VKVSALGIEEQRVPTTIDLIDPPEAWSRLGHDFRVIVHVSVWRAEDALTVPVGALFRDGDQWAVFVVRMDVQGPHRSRSIIGTIAPQR
jgi:HlyD family secretion protein